MPRVLITPPELFDGNGPCHEILRAAGMEIVYPPPGLRLSTEDLLHGHLQGIDAMIAGVEPFTRRVLSAAQLRVIARYGVGYDAIDVPAATDHNVVITIAAGANQISVAEHMLALLLGVFRAVAKRDRDIRAGTWKRFVAPRWAGALWGWSVWDASARPSSPAQALGLSIIVHDPLADQGFARQHGLRLCSLDELLCESDIVSLHLPCTPETAHMMNAARFAQMKPGSVLINTARGGLVDERALIDALRSGHLWGAGLDCFETEPLPVDSPLVGMDNVVLTPHNAGIDAQAVIDVSTLCARCIVDLHAGRWPPEECVVNRALRPGWAW